MTVESNNVFNFPKGIPGFEELTQFSVIDIPDTPFAQLQSIEEDSISLLITDPFMFYPDYEFDLPPSIVEELELKSNLLIRNIVTTKPVITDSTINLLAPIIFNLDNNQARQVILQSTEYLTRHELWKQDSSEVTVEQGGE